jgi:TolB-like protein
MQQLPGFFREFWRHRLVRFAAIYFATAWLLFQVTLAVTQTLHLPDWVDQTALVFFAVGFPLVMILAWARGTGPAAAAHSEAESAGTHPQQQIALSKHAAPDGDHVTMDRTSIAALPFHNASGNSDYQYFVDDITESVITSLSRWRWFFVIARDSSFTYRRGEMTPAHFGRQLGVRYVMDGSVRKLGDRVRVTVQLIDTTTAAQIWTESFDRELSNILALEDEITQQVVDAIEPELSRSEGARAVRKNLKDLTAFDCYQRGMWHFNKVTREGYVEALAQFRLAIERDSEMSLGYTGLARTLYAGVAYGWADEPREEIVKAKEAATAALRLDRRDAYGHFALSGALLYLAQHADALEEAQKTIALNPNFGFGHFRLGQVLIYAGRAKDAIAPIERSLLHSPYDPQMGGMRGLLALAYFHAGNYELAVRNARAAITLKNVRTTPVLAAALARLGRRDEATDVLRFYSLHQSTPGGTKNALRVPYANDADLQILRDSVREIRQYVTVQANAQ